jgi:hypothetical protein
MIRMLVLERGSATEDIESKTKTKRAVNSMSVVGAAGGRGIGGSVAVIVAYGLTDAPRRTKVPALSQALAFQREVAKRLTCARLA